MAKIPFTNWEIGTIKERKLSPGFFISTGDKISVEEIGKSFVPNTIRLSTDVGIPHPFDFKVYENAYKLVPIVYAATDKQVEYSIGPGYYVECEDEDSKEIIDEFFEKTHFEIFLSQFTRNMLIYGSAFAEIAWQVDEISGWIMPVLKNLDPNFMYVRMDKKFNLLGYTQFDGQQKIFFNPNEIVHASFNQIGDSPYGNSIFSSLVMGGKVQALTNKLVIEDIMIKLLKRKANSPLHFKLGNENYTPTQEVIDSFANKLTAMKDDTEFVTSDLVDGKIYDFNLAKFDYPLAHYENQIIYALQTPHVLLGVANVPEGLAKAQGDGFKKRIQAIQQAIEKIMENDILTPMLLKNSKSTTAEFCWNDDGTEEENLEIQKYLQIVNSFAITPQTKLDAENKIRAILELEPINELPQAQAPAPLNQPGSPPQQNPNYKQPAESIREARSKWYSIREDVASDFAVSSYVLDFLKSYMFPDITDFSKRKKNVLKDVITNGIQNQDGINAMVNDLVDRTGIDKAKAETIIRTEVARAENQGALDAYKDSEEVEEVIFQAAEDDRVDEKCMELDGKVYKLGEQPEIPVHPLCRCTYIPRLKEL